MTRNTISGDQSDIPGVLVRAKHNYLQICDGKLGVYTTQLNEIETLTFEQKADLKARIAKLTEIRKNLEAAMGGDIFKYPEVLSL